MNPILGTAFLLYLAAHSARDLFCSLLRLAKSVSRAGRSGGTSERVEMMP